MDKKAIVSTLKKNAMLVVLVLVYLFFMVLTGGGIFRPTSFNALISQNAYVYILGCGMLMCMLTGGNIDLSCGAFVCLLGAISGVLMVIQGWGTGVMCMFRRGSRPWLVIWHSADWAPLSCARIPPQVRSDRSRTVS